jgi:serine protease AprX
MQLPCGLRETRRQMKKLLLLLLITGAQLIFAGSKLSPDLPKSSGNNLIDVIVRFKNNTQKANSNSGNQKNGNQNNGNQNNGNQGEGDHQNWNHNDDYNNDVQQVGQHGEVEHTWQNINSVHMKLTLNDIRALQADPSVLYVTPNRPLKGTLDVTDQTVNAPLAWKFGWDGTGVGVAVVDSGITVKNDLMSANKQNARVVYSQSFVSTEDPSDLYGHGTHVAGIIGANGANSSGAGFSRTFKGIAPNVNLISLKVLDQNGGGQESDVIAAIQTAIQLKNVYNIRVLNLSLGRPVFESYALDPLCQAVEAAWQAGIVVVVAAGNSGRDNSLGTHGYGTIASPGIDPYVITVGATNTRGTPQIWDDIVASYSSKGPTLIDHIAKPDLVAPGNAIVSLLASPTATLYQMTSRTQVSDSYYQIGTSGKSTDYFRLSGTSMATPVVAGAAALLIQKDPTLTPDTVKARLMKSAAKILPTYQTATDNYTGQQFQGQRDLFSAGAGYLDVNAALANTDIATKPALSPVVSYNTTSHHVAFVRNYSMAWGSSVTWGDLNVWGPTAFAGALSNGLSVVWGESVTWGDITVSGFSIIWGDLSGVIDAITATSDDDYDQ